ncbi:hypothetical protein [Streptomyces sp. NPDC087856]|uniref:hypothetical protein n=1 Tax=Streptomyces sp. NPDC087856 TaxID=3365811 RepID=UPI0037F82A54
MQLPDAAVAAIQGRPATARWSTSRMVDHRQAHTARWIRYFVERGYGDARPLGVGVEGAVYRLGGGVVGKVWSGRRPAGVGLMRRVYEDIAREAEPLPFGTPEILGVEEYEGVLVTYERELRGVQLRADSAVVASGRELPASETGALLTVLRGLAAVPGSDAMRGLVVQGDDQPLWEGCGRFPDALAGLVQRAAGVVVGFLQVRSPTLRGLSAGPWSPYGRFPTAVL